MAWQMMRMKFMRCIVLSRSTVQSVHIAHITTDENKKKL